ncbi:MAG TPA: tetratricopeptide repeat protein [Beijerinckiaceae bacterium]|jgi:tetratricopeptide (TPR) repeat protein
MGPERFCLYVVGRLHGVTRERLAALVAAAGGRLVRTAGPRVDLVCVAHGTVPALLGTHAVELPQGIPEGCRTLSELSLRRLLGLAPPLPAHNRAFTAADVAGRSGLASDVVRALALYDVLEPCGDDYGYGDLLAAREVGRLLRAGLPLGAIIEAAGTLRRSGRTLSDTRLHEAPWGEMLQEVAGRLGRLDGQFTLPLAETFESVDGFFERAEELERAGDLAEAERLYRIALRIDRTDPVLPFNLGNVLEARQRPEEAALAYRQAIARDPCFSEAWLNLGLLKEGGGDSSGAADCYRRALDPRPDYADALFNLALLLTRREDYDAALPLWDRFLALRPAGKEARQARRMAMLCRMGALPRPASAAAC